MTNDPAGPVKIGLVQINNSFSGQNYLPYSIALLQTYVQKFAADPSRYEFLTPLYKRVRIADAVEALKDADLVGFSTYVWNGRISLEIARRLKALKPGIVIVFGGPHVPDQPEAFLRANPQIDLAVHNEGERTFLKLLEAWPDRDAWAALAGVSMVKADGYVRAQPQHRPRARPRRDPVAVPRGRVRRRSWPPIPNESWIGLWETNRGCPFRCTFCDWGSATAAKVTKFGEERLFARGRLVRRAEDRVHLLLRRQLRHPAARRRHRQLRRRRQEEHRLSAWRCRCRTPRTPPSAPTSRRRSCPTPASTRAWRSRCRAST